MHGVAHSVRRVVRYRMHEQCTMQPTPDRHTHPLTSIHACSLTLLLRGGLRRRDGGSRRQRRGLPANLRESLRGGARGGDRGAVACCGGRAALGGHRFGCGSGALTEHPSHDPSALCRGS